MEAEQQRRDWWALGAGVGLALLFLAVSVQKIWAGDFWGQLYTGQLILERGKLPRADEYTFTATGHPVTEVRWLYCVLIALGWKVGPWLLCVAMAAVLRAMWGAIVWSVRKAAASPAGLFILGLGMVAGLGRWVLRPELATDFFVAVFLVGLENARRRGRIGWAWGLVGVQVLWVSMHSVSIFGPVLAWMFAGSAVAGRIGWGEKRSWKFATQSALLALAVTGACWINPYFHAGATYPLEMWREAGGVVGEVLAEMKSPLEIPIGLWRWDLWAALALAVLVAGTYVLNWRKIGPARLGVLVIALYLGATAQRNMSLLAIMAVWAGLTNLSEAAAAMEWPRIRWGRRAAFASVTLAAMWSAWYVASDQAWASIGVGRESGLGVVERDVAQGAAEFVVGSGADTRVFNNMRDGHYLSWWSRGKIKVFIDGRTDVFGDAFLREYTSVGPGTWDATTEKWKINTAVLPVRGFEDLIRFLMRNKAWALVYLDHRNVVFVRDRPEQAELIAKSRIDPAKRWAATDEPRETIEAWKTALGAEPRPWYRFGMAQSFLAIGSMENAEEYLRRTLEASPSHERALAELAAICWLTGRDSEGDQLQAKLDKGSEWSQYSYRSLAGMLMDAGRNDEAVGAMKKAIDAGAHDAALYVSVGDWNFGRKQYAAARADYEGAVKAGTDTAAEWKKLGYAREQTGDLKGAEDAYRRSLTRDGKQHEVWYLLGLAQARGGNKDAARVSLATALRINPGFGPAKKALEDLAR